MDAVRDILDAHGYQDPGEMAVGDHIEIDPDRAGQMPLVIEKVGPDRVAVAHYHTQNGDVMYDPEIVFRIYPTGTWMAVEYTQHPHTYQRDETGLVEAQDFAVNTWNENLQRQGYVDAAQNGGDR